MGETEVIEWLKNQRSISDEYYSIAEIRKGLNQLGYNNSWLRCLGKILLQLEKYDFIESTMSYKLNDWNRKFRYKKGEY